MKLPTMHTCNSGILVRPFKEEVLRRLDSMDVAMVRRVNRGFRAVVESSSDLPRAGVSQELPLMVDHFVGFAERLAWAKKNGCPW